MKRPSKVKQEIRLLKVFFVVGVDKMFCQGKLLQIY